MNEKRILLATGALVAAGSFALLSAQVDRPAAEAKDLWRYITETRPYEQWEPWPGKDGFVPGTSPHGKFLKLYVNEPAADALEAGEPMPNGAIIVKENYETERALSAVTPMYRVDGYNPDGGDWFWAKYGKDGTVETSGKVQSCIDCHSQAGGDDWLFTE